MPLSPLRRSRPARPRRRQTVPELRASRRAAMAVGADPANTDRMYAKAAIDAAAAQGIAPDDEAELERRLRELEEELQSLLGHAGGTEGEAVSLDERIAFGGKPPARRALKQMARQPAAADLTPEGASA